MSCWIRTQVERGSAKKKRQKKKLVQSRLLFLFSCVFAFFLHRAGRNHEPQRTHQGGHIDDAERTPKTAPVHPRKRRTRKQTGVTERLHRRPGASTHRTRSLKPKHQTMKGAAPTSRPKRVHRHTHTRRHTETHTTQKRTRKIIPPSVTQKWGKKETKQKKNRSHPRATKIKQNKKETKQPKATIGLLFFPLTPPIHHREASGVWWCFWLPVPPAYPMAPPSPCHADTCT